MARTGLLEPDTLDRNVNARKPVAQEQGDQGDGTEAVLGDRPAAASRHRRGDSPVARHRRRAGSALAGSASIEAKGTDCLIGNEAVHPGTIDLKDDPGTTLSLFELVNIVVEAMVT